MVPLNVTHESWQRNQCRCASCHRSFEKRQISKEENKHSLRLTQEESTENGGELRFTMRLDLGYALRSVQRFFIVLMSIWFVFLVGVGDVGKDTKAGFTAGYII